MFAVMETWEKLLVVAMVSLAAGAIMFWFGAFYMHSTKAVPAVGGTYTEGIVGQPLYINPVLSQSGGADADIARLIYAGLFTHDKDGKLQKDIVEDYVVSEDGKTYTMTLKDGVRWHDGEILSADDVAYTYRIIQDPLYKSPLRSNWQGVMVNAVDDHTVSFVLSKPYFGFLENLTTGILPKHIWEGIVPEKFSLTEANLSPVGTGPYMVSTFKKDSNGNILSYELKVFPEYFGGAPYITKIIFHFYPTEELLVDAYDRREVMGMGSISPKGWERMMDRKSSVLREARQPRIFAVFFNDKKSVSLGYTEVRRALSMAVDRDKVVQASLEGHGEALTSPFLRGMFGYDESAQAMSDRAQAIRILEDAGWQTGDDGIRRKNNVTLAFEMVTPDWPDLMETSEELRRQWQEIGVRVDIRAVGVADLQQTIIRPREYQALLFGEVSSFNPDPYSFWHSSQKADPGTNFSLFEDQDSDNSLALAREALDDTARSEQYSFFQKRLLELVPAVFLYSPHYLYVVNGEVQGIDLGAINTSSDRFNGAARWYIETDRVRK